jgi:hypothetical protein
MKQEVFVIGRSLRDLVPFSLAFNGPDYAVTLVEAQDVVSKAAALARQNDAWYLLILSGDDEDEAQTSRRFEDLAPTTSMVIEDCDDPVIALAHLIAAARWETPAVAEAPVASGLEATEQYG